MTTRVIMPQLGESVVEGTVARWLKHEGDSVTAYEPLFEISTDKVDTEVPAPVSGVLLQILVPEGTTVQHGVLLAIIGEPDEATEGLAGSTPDAHMPVPQLVEAALPDQTAAGRISPVVARMASEYDLDLSKLRGTGLGGRVTKKDVEAYLASRASAPASVNGASDEPPPWEQFGSGDLFKPSAELFAKTSEGGRALAASNATVQQRPTEMPSPGAQASHPSPASASDGELVALSPMRRAIAEHMVRSKLQTAPHVTTVFEVDLGAVLAHRAANLPGFQQQGVRLTLTAYFVLAAVRALQAYPWLNSQWTDAGALVHHAVHMGIAVAIPDGLIVPVIRNAQDLNLVGIARQVNDLAARARSKQLRPDDVTGGTFSITNHGVSGSLIATPIINQPQAAILGTGAMQKRVVVLSDERGDTIAIRPMMYATLTFDHRLIDGALADGFLRTFKDTLEGWA